MRTYLQVISLTLLLFGITSCRIVPANERQSIKSLESLKEVIDKDRDKRGNLALSQVEKAPGDVYETKYILCNSYCADRPKRAATTTTVATWGKPTEIGFIYPEQSYPQSMAFNPSKKIIYNGITITNMQAQLVIKSRGLLPPLRQPLGTAKFTPVATLIPMFFPEKSNPPMVAEAKGSVRTGNVKILSVKKLSPTEANIYIKKAKNPPNLATIGAMEESLYKEIQTYAAYYEFYKNKPDIKPQQVEKISQLVNTTPQVIQIKKW